MLGLVSPPATGPRTVFHHRDFLFLQVAKSLATLGFHMEITTVGYQVYSLTREPLNLGIIGLTYFIPAIVFALATGYIADHFDRRRVDRLRSLSRLSFQRCVPCHARRVRHDFRRRPADVGSGDDAAGDAGPRERRERRLHRREQ
jgi:hypothetical protein